jgi:ribosome-associated protein
VRLRFLSKYASKITIDGEVIVTSQKFRDQGRNFDDCMEKLRAMIFSVVAAPIPRRETKPSRAMKARRVESKRETSVKKQQRQRPALDD